MENVLSIFFYKNWFWNNLFFLVKDYCSTALPKLNIKTNACGIDLFHLDALFASKGSLVWGFLNRGNGSKMPESICIVFCSWTHREDVGVRLGGFLVSSVNKRIRRLGLLMAQLVTSLFPKHEDPSLILRTAKLGWARWHKVSIQIIQDRRWRQKIPGAVGQQPGLLGEDQWQTVSQEGGKPLRNKQSLYLFSDIPSPPTHMVSGERIFWNGKTI